MLKRFLSPPIPYAGDSFFEEAKYLLSYKSSLFLALMLGLLSLVFVVLFDYIFALFTFIGFLGIFLGFFHIYCTGRFRTTILLINVFGATLCQLTMYAIPNTPHIADGFWMMVNVVFAMMTIPKRWAYVIGYTHGISIFIFYLFFYNEQLVLLENLTLPQLFGFGLNIAFTFFIMAYLTWQNIHTTQIAERKLQHANEQLSRNNHEMSLMLKEIHHRVKNNLQVIISLLRLQSNELKNSEAIEKFNETVNRVVAMSKVHEKMYQSTELTKLDLKDYLYSLGRDMITSYNATGNVSLTIECSIITSDIKFIVPLGLLFNELISNSLKHAFKQNGKGSITIIITQSGRELLISYTDSGEWIESKAGPSFGMDLIDTLVDQLGGSYTLRKGPTHYTFIFEQFETGSSDPFIGNFNDTVH